MEIQTNVYRVHYSELLVINFLLMRNDRKILTNLDLQKIYNIRERCFVNLMNYCNDFDAKIFHGKNTGLI